MITPFGTEKDMFGEIVTPCGMPTVTVVVIELPIARGGKTLISMVGGTTLTATLDVWLTPDSDVSLRINMRLRVAPLWMDVGGDMVKEKVVEIVG